MADASERNTYSSSMVPRQSGLPQKHSYSFLDFLVIGSSISNA